MHSGWRGRKMVWQHVKSLERKASLPSAQRLNPVRVRLLRIAIAQECLRCHACSMQGLGMVRSHCKVDQSKY